MDLQRRADTDFRQMTKTSLFRCLRAGRAAYRLSGFAQGDCLHVLSQQSSHSLVEKTLRAHPETNSRENEPWPPSERERCCVSLPAVVAAL